MGHVKDVEGRLVGGTGEGGTRGTECQREDGGGIDAAPELDDFGTVARRVYADNRSLLNMSA